jgi:hypothetical protein
VQVVGDRALGGRVQVDHAGLAALAQDAQRAAPAGDVQVGAVEAAELGHAQAESEQRDHRS